MKFWFCEKCGKRVTDGDLEQGNARDKKARGMHCSDCAPGVMTEELPAIQDPVDAPPPPRRETASKIPPVARPSQAAIEAARPAHPSLKKHARAESDSNNTLLIGGVAAGVVVLGLALVVMGGGSNPPRPAPAPTLAVETPAAAPPPAPAINPGTTVPPQGTPAPTSSTGSLNTSDSAETAFAQLTQDVNKLPQGDVTGRMALIQDFLEKHSESNTASRAQLLLRDLREQASSAARTPSSPPDATLPENPAPAPQTPAPAPTPTPTPEPPVATPAFVPSTPKTGDEELAYRVYVLELGNAVRARRTDLAKFIQKAHDDPQLAAHKNDIAVDQKIVQWLANLDTLLPKGAERLKDADLIELKLTAGAPVKVGKRADLQFQKLDGDTMHLSGRGMNVSLALEKLAPESRTELISLACGADVGGGLPRAVLACLAVDAAAETWIDDARKGAAPADLIVVERLLKAVRSSVFEEAAQKALDAMEKTAAASNWKRLYEEFVRFTDEFGRSVTAQRATDRLDRLAANVGITLAAVADTYVQDGQAKRNFGSEKALIVKCSPPTHTRVVYVQFDLSKYKAPLGSAKVRLRPATVALKGTKLIASIANSNWEETTLIWADRPAPGAAIANWRAAKDEVWEFDVTEAARLALARTNRLTVCISAADGQSSNAIVHFASREDAERAPTLTISALADPRR